MVKHCVVHGCKIGLALDRKNRDKNNVRQPSLFRVPQCNVLKQKWILALSQDLIKSQFVCENHFREEDIIKDDRFVINKITTIIPRERWALRNDVIPINQQDFKMNISEVLQQVTTSQSENKHSQMAEQHRLKTSPDISEVEYVKIEPHLEECNVTETLTNNLEVLDVRKVSITESNSPSLNFDPLFTLEEINNHFRSVLMEGWCYFAIDAKLIFIHINLRTRKEDMRFIVAENLSVKVSFAQRPEFPKDVIISSVDDIRNLMANLQTTILCQGTGIFPHEFVSECTGEVSRDDYKRRRKEPRCSQCRHFRIKLQNARAPRN